MAAASVSILGVRVDYVDFEQTLAQIGKWINRAEGQIGCRQICTVNPEFLIDSRTQPAFATVLKEADLCVPDGMGILWAARLQGVKLKERVTGSDGIYRICERAAQQGWRVYFLGAAAGVAEQTAQRMAQIYPGLQVAGCDSGSPADKEWAQVSTKLDAAQPDILFVAFGHPKQDYWIAQHRKELSAHVAIGVGGAFDFVAGVQHRAPIVWQKAGLEWLYRLLTQPWRWRRMLKLPKFVLLVLSEHFTKGNL